MERISCEYGGTGDYGSIFLRSVTLFLLVRSRFRSCCSRIMALLALIDANHKGGNSSMHRTFSTLPLVVVCLALALAVFAAPAAQAQSVKGSGSVAGYTGGAEFKVNVY